MSETIDRLARFAMPALEGEPAGAGAGRRYVLMDVFAEAPLEGNPLAVFTDGRGIVRARMQAIARELNLSETVFPLPAEAGGDARLRIFTPSSELPFAGHPVLGAGVLLAIALGRTQLALETGAGIVALRLEPADRSAAGRYAAMAQPVPTCEPYEHEGELLRALGVERSGLPVEVYRNGPQHVYVELADDAELAALRPDMRALASLPAVGANCFARREGGWRTRMFAPALGVPEDPATGSAAGPLAVHLARHGRIRFGEQIAISQGIEIGRPSLLHARVEGSPERIELVEVGGRVVIVGQGQLLLA